MKKLLIGLSVLICLLTISLFWMWALTLPVNKEGKEVIFEIKTQTITKQIVKNLKSSNLIKSENIMLLKLRLNKKNIQAGTYALHQNMDMDRIIDTLVNGKTYNQSIRITIPEGKNMRQLAAIISKKMSYTESDIMDAINDKDYVQSKIDQYDWLDDDITSDDIYYPLEGYLFPDTYEVGDNNEALNILFDKMLDRMDDVITNNKENFSKSKYNVHQIMTMASVVELEGISNESRATIAGIFYNRMSKNMPLGSDVTTYYAAKVNMNERDLKQSEINASNPYNTRGPNMSGKLPVGPVANPGLNAILAALSPVSSNYLYFVADKNKKIYYSKTYDEHLSTVSRLKSEGLWYTYN